MKLPIFRRPSTAEELRSGERGSGERGSGERGSGERGSEERGSEERGSEERGPDLAEGQHSETANGGRFPSREGPFLSQRRPELATPLDPKELRENILNNILTAASLLGVIAFLVNIPRTIQLAMRGTDTAQTSLAQVMQWGLLAFYTLALLIIIWITFDHRPSYNLRAALFLSLVFFLGLGALVNDGLYGSGRIFLFSIPILANLLGGRRAGFIGLLLSIGSFLTIGLLISAPPPLGGVIPVAGLSQETHASPLSWIVSLVNFALLAIISALSLSILVQNLENSLYQQKSLTHQLEDERLNLEENITERTEDLQRRLLQIRTAAEISRAVISAAVGSSIGAELDTGRLLLQISELIRQRFDLYYVGIFITTLDHQDGASGLSQSPTLRTSPGTPVEEYVQLAAGTGEAGAKMLANKHKLLIGGDSMIGQAVALRQARIALDVGKEAVRFDNPLLPLTRSELALPILAQERPLGAITIQSSQPAAFDQDDIVVLQGIADSLASALQNSRLFAELQTRLDEIQTLHRQYLERSWAEILASKGRLAYTWQAPGAAQPDQTAQPGGITLSGRPLSSSRHPAPETDTLRLPIRLRDEIIGSLTLQRDETGSRGAPAESPTWTPEQMKLIDAVTTQAALALENARLLETTQYHAEQERLSANIVGQIWASSDVETILRTTLRELGVSLQASDGLIQLEIEDIESSDREAAVTSRGDAQ